LTCPELIQVNSISPGCANTESTCADRKNCGRYCTPSAAPAPVAADSGNDEALGGPDRNPQTAVWPARKPDLSRAVFSIVARARPSPLFDPVGRTLGEPAVVRAA
jgi:hypothetical protein